MKGGVPVMEMSYTLNNAGDIIQGLSEKYKDALCVGAGTVLDAETARHAILHGADFIIAPNMRMLQKCAIAIRFLMLQDVLPLRSVWMH